MAFGPIQILAFGFPSTDRLEGRIAEELERASDAGIIRIIDALAVLAEDDEVEIVRVSDLDDDEREELGAKVGALIGLGAAGIDLPAGLPGINLLDDGAVVGRDAVFGECFTHDAVDLDEPANSLRWRWCVAGDWKLIVPNPAREPNAAPELYHLSADPHEERDLAASAPERVLRLRERLDAWQTWRSR